MLFDERQVGSQFERYVHEGKFDLPSDLDPRQRVVFDHLAQAVPQSLFQALEESINFLFQEEVRLLREASLIEGDAERVAELRGKVIEQLAQSGQLRPLMGRENKSDVASYLVYDLKSLVDSLPRT